MGVSLDIRTIEAYRNSCLELCAEKLRDYDGLEALKADENRLNAYPRLARLEEPRGVVTLDPPTLSAGQIQRAVECVLDGRFLAEHAAAGEATRLKMGTKYLINPRERLTLESMALAWSEAAGEEMTPGGILNNTGRGAAPGPAGPLPGQPAHVPDGL